MPLESNNLLRDLVNEITGQIREKNPSLPIPLKDSSRAGAQISAYFESQMEVLINSGKYESLANARKGPGTKSPFDIEFYHHTEKIWVDFKAWKLSDEGDWPSSNPDMGTFRKIGKLGKEEVSHFLYVHLFYKKGDDENVLLIDTPEHCPYPVFFIQEIPKGFNVSSNNQMHYSNTILDSVKIDRVWVDFLDLLDNKLKLAFQVDLRKAQKKMDDLAEFIDGIRDN